MLRNAINKLTEYCDRGRREQNVVSFTAGTIVSIILIIIRIVSVYVN